MCSCWLIERPLQWQFFRNGLNDEREVRPLHVADLRVRAYSMQAVPGSLANSLYTADLFAGCHGGRCPVQQRIRLRGGDLDDSLQFYYPLRTADA